MAQKVVIGVLEFDDRYLLIQRRLDDKFRPGNFAFPGGKVEAGEHWTQALEREVKEETGCTTTNYHLMANAYVGEFEVIVSKCDLVVRGAFNPNEVAGVVWLRPDEIRSLLNGEKLCPFDDIVLGILNAEAGIRL